MVFPLDDNFVFGDNFFFLADNFFFAEGDKKNYSAKKKKLLTNKRSYSSNGNTIIPMIWRFYATSTPFFWAKLRQKHTAIHTNIVRTLNFFSLLGVFLLMEIKIFYHYVDQKLIYKVFTKKIDFSPSFALYYACSKISFSYF